LNKDISGLNLDFEKMKGMNEAKGKEKPRSMPKKCPRCDTLCASSEELCHKCGMALTLKAAIQKDEELKELTESIKKLEESDKELKEILRALKLSANGKVEIEMK
jgi:hypothetical protein